MTDKEKWIVPWTPEQVRVLNLWQTTGVFHPYTCPNDEHEYSPSLLATPSGWICPGPDGCLYRQNWAWAVDESLVTP